MTTGKLKRFNGRGSSVVPRLDTEGIKVYVGACSVEDVRRVCTEAGMLTPSRHEVVKYWNKGVWGVAMSGNG